MLRLTSVFSILVLGGALGCSSDGPDDPAGGGGSAGAGGGGGGASGSGGSAGGDVPCSEDPADILPGATCVHSVSGRVVDATGAPRGGVVSSVCGPICYYGDSNPDGSFTVEVGAHIVLPEYSALAHVRPDGVNYYYQLSATEPGPAIDVGDLLVLDLPDGPPLDTDGNAQTVTSGDVTLDLPDGIKIKLDPEDLAEGDEGKKFRTLKIDEQHWPGYAIDVPMGFAALYAFAPFEARFQNPDKSPTTARLSFANTTSLAADTAVEFLALGSYLYPDWVTPAAFEVVATGTVSSDGTTIELDPGEGFLHLTWVGIREKS